MAPNTVLGRGVPNLLVEFDNEKGFEFRVQLEAGITDPAAARELTNLLIQSTPESLEKAKAIAMSNLSARATGGFRSIVEKAFEENIQRAREAQGKGSSDTKR